MLGGLLLASISTVLVQSALFQRKSRSGWLDELDEIREGALRDGEIDDGVSVSDIWTDLRDGGSYEDPHEISGLYASDDTPDAPGPKEPPRRKEKAKGRGRDKAKARAVAEDESPIVDGAPAGDAGPSEAPVPTETPVPAETPVLRPPVAPAAGRAPVHEAPAVQPLADPPATPAPELAPAASTEAEGEQLWVQPAPHPVRPSEMWHPQEMGAPSLGEPSVEPVEERVSSAELDQGRRETPPFEFQEMTAALEAELVAAADVTVVGQPDATAPIESGAGPLVGAPVGRRNRRDRPTLPTAPAATTTAAPAAPVVPAPPGPGDRSDVPGPADPTGPADLPPLAARGETSPLPTEPLPPAAIPAPSAKLPVAPREEAAAPQVAPEPVPATPEPVADEVPSGAGATVPEGPRLFSRPPTPAALAPSEVQPAEAPAAELEATPEPAEATSFEVDAPAPQPAAEPTPPPAPTVRALAVADDGMVDVPGTIVRVRSEGEVSATAGDAIVEIAVDRGWTWVSPGDGPATAVRVELPHASVRIAAGATALAVAEVDGSAFVIVADGSVDLERTEGGGTLTRGTVAMVDAAGEVNLDQASDAEIEGDPLVAENLALDAEL